MTAWSYKAGDQVMMFECQLLAENSQLSVNCLGTAVIKSGGEAVPKLRKTYPAGHGLPFAYARITVHFAIIQNCIFLLFTMAYEILRGSMGC